MSATLSQYYASRAREYDAIYDKPERQSDLALLRSVLGPMLRDKTVLEILPVAPATGHSGSRATAPPLSARTSTLKCCSWRRFV